MIRHIVIEIIVTEEEMFHCSLEIEDMVCTQCHAGEHQGQSAGREREGQTWSKPLLWFPQEKRGKER